MLCLKPYHGRRTIEGKAYRIRVSCGTCRNCLIRRKMAWMGRCVLERNLWGTGRCLTLTYADDPGRLDYRDMQAFLKRYRYYHGSEFKYFVVGEYGDQGNRGHWHVLIFGHPPTALRQHVEEPAWKAGIVYEDDMSEKAIRYVVGYVLKKMTEEARPIARMSLKDGGIGLTSIYHMAAEVARKHGLLAEYPSYYFANGKRYPLYGGGRRMFAAAYLKSGGIPPVERSPEERDWEVALFEQGGYRIQEIENAATLLKQQKGLTGGQALLPRSFEAKARFVSETYIL